MANLLKKKTRITTTFYFAAEEESACRTKKYVSLNSKLFLLMQAFCNTGNNFNIEKTVYKGLEQLKIVPHDICKDI